ncbi:MAG: prolyl oligopeptidase family serine peptidase, partial [Longimicrobiales bacterium]
MRSFLGVRVAFALVLVAAPVVAQDENGAPADRLTLDDYLNWESVGDPQLSPDGRQIVYTRGWVDKLNDSRESSLHIMNVDGSRPRGLLDGSSPRWSPDGTRIAYLAEGEPEGSQIFVRWMDAEGAVTQVTRLLESPSGIAWSPDGKWIAFQMIVPDDAGWSVEGQAMKFKPKGADWTAAPRVVEDVQYRRDRRGFLPQGTEQIFVVPAEGGTPRQVSSGEWDTGSPVWMPDGNTILFSSDPRIPESEYAWRESEIYSLDVASGEIRQLTTRKGPDGDALPSPDGGLIAYTGRDWSTDTWADEELYVMNADGSGARMIADIDRSPGDLEWAPDGGGVYFTAQNEGKENLWFAPLDGEPRQVTEGVHRLSVGDMGKDGLVVGTRTTFHEPGDIVTFNVRSPAEIRELTDVNADVLMGKELGEVEEIWYTSSDGLRIQGWIVKPPDFDAARKYPLILTIHGGPHSMYGVGFNFGWQEHAAHDYVLLYPNPRGSTGYGSEFGNAIKNAYPGKDFDDLMAGVDA